MRCSWMVVAAAVACGPSNAEIKTARSAVYKTTPQQVLSLALEATQETYQVGERSADGFQTVPRFYTATGELESAGAQNTVMVKPGSVRVTFHVKVESESGDFVKVDVTPETYQTIEGSPMPRELKPDDPYLPPFVLGRADSLAMAIYEHAKPYLVP